MLFCIGFLLVFLIGGLTGPMIASPPFDLHVTRHLLHRRPHALRPVRDGRLRVLRRPLLLVPQVHRPPPARGPGQAQLLADVRRVQPDVLGPAPAGPAGDAPAGVRLRPRHRVGGAQPRCRASARPSSALSMLVLLVNLWRTWKRGEPAGDDPWGGYSLEWATSSPPPEHNFHSLPPIRSERPVFDARQAAPRDPRRRPDERRVEAVHGRGRLRRRGRGRVLVRELRARRHHHARVLGGRLPAGGGLPGGGRAAGSAPARPTGATPTRRDEAGRGRVLPVEQRVALRRRLRGGRARLRAGVRRRAWAAWACCCWWPAIGGYAAEANAKR